MIRRWTVQHRWELTIGLGLTLVAMVLHMTGPALVQRLELLWYDLHVLNFSKVDGSERIVHIDIGDDAFDRVGSWPWPRDIQAELIRTLNELGAEKIIMDLVFRDPKPGEVRMPSLDPFADIEGEIEQIGEVSEENLIFPDLELAQAVADAGNVYLGMYYVDKLIKYQKTPSPTTQKILELLGQDFSLDSVSIAQQTGEEKETVDAILAGLKRRVARKLVGEYIASNPDSTARQVHQAFLSTPFNQLTADRADILAAYAHEKGLQQLREIKKDQSVPPALKDKLPKAEQVDPLLDKFTSNARDVGFVNFKPDIDGRTRHVPILREWNGLMIEQLAFSAACDILDIELQDLSIDDAGFLRIPKSGNRKAMRIQLDDQGQTLLNWHIASRHWQDCFAHLPVTKLLQIYDCKKQTKDNQTRKQWRIAQALHLVKEEQGFKLYRDSVNEMLKKERQVRWAKLQSRAETEKIRQIQARAKQLRQLIEQDQADTIEFIIEQWTELKAETNPNDPEIAEDYKRFEKAYYLITDEVDKLEAANRKIAIEKQKLIEQLKPLIENKICFIGYTATAVADMVTTPAYERMPGVLIHSNLLNSFLQGQFRSWADKTTQITMLALFGLLMTLLTTNHGPRTGFVLAMIVILISFMANVFVFFNLMNHWLPLCSAHILTFVVWAMIVLIRYLTTERQRRQFSKAVAQYVSPAIARQIADSGVNFDFSPVEGDVTCFFSDLQGFTRISERLGPEGTKTLLNPYLEAMSQTLHKHQALINKFMGDGIFAFYNPPILPCSQHQKAACESALECIQALKELAARHAQHPLSSEFKQLFMRIGIASGSVFVGDYGSENKLDYTCVGDTVNLAARLESANKQFGTSIMITGQVLKAAGDNYLCRHLGSIQVKGQTVGVPVHELLGRSGEVDDNLLRYADAFSEAVALFAKRDWDRATTSFDKCLKLQPYDPGVWQYMNAIGGYQKTPPPDDWNTALELTEK
ncbi:MAG: CHASE2 domain-containing protein [Planctomycetota bacterium]|nr:MAG: CHASE2 domain-containing protein [Planctomycetota bacterium]